MIRFRINLRCQSLRKKNAHIMTNKEKKGTHGLLSTVVSAGLVYHNAKPKTPVKRGNSGLGLGLELRFCLPGIVSILM